jgi:hypothetical protein
MEFQNISVGHTDTYELFFLALKQFRFKAGTSAVDKLVVSLKHWHLFNAVGE